MHREYDAQATLACTSDGGSQRTDTAVFVRVSAALDGSRMGGFEDPIF